MRTRVGEKKKTGAHGTHVLCIHTVALIQWRDFALETSLQKLSAGIWHSFLVDKLETGWLVRVSLKNQSCEIW